MKRTETLKKILDLGVVAVIRLPDTQKLLKVIQAVAQGGIRCIEITMTVPNAVEMIRQMKSQVSSDVLLGAGTVTDNKTARDVIQAGAEFVVGPILNLEIIKECHRHDTVAIPGCYTPTEIFSAWNAGADIVKIFPATSLGPKFIKDMRGPFPDIRLMPTGGVSIDNIGEWIEAGAAAVGIGSDLLDKKAIEEERYDVLTDRAKKMVGNLKRVRTK
jgi:2-dehydro-3-deoxyphosphogluconate aldolase/(4S)-4-hydroxy-2-oxoglutarate aldolase